MVREACKLFSGPLLLDADGLRSEIIDSLADQDHLVLTPHAGELDRLAGRGGVENFLSSFQGVILRKEHTSKLFMMVLFHICFQGVLC